MMHFFKLPINKSNILAKTPISRKWQFLFREEYTYLRLDTTNFTIVSNYEI
jgi:hypothetical protein